MKKAGRGRAKSRISSSDVEPGSFFLTGVPAPPCWSSGISSDSNLPCGVSTDTVDASQLQKVNGSSWLNSHRKPVLSGNIPTGTNGKVEDSFQLKYTGTGDEDAENKPLNPEAELELANDHANAYELEQNQKLKEKIAEDNDGSGKEAGNEGSEMRCFVSAKLHFDPKLSQEKRRAHILNWQKKRRDEMVDKVRHLENDSWSEDDADEMMDFVKIQEERKKGNKQWSGRYQTKPTNRRWHNQARVMLSEWMVDKPEDFEENWLGVMCPVGLRCLVVASRGKTRIITRRGFMIGEFQSCLPAGRKYQKHQGSMGAPGRGVTILDCIWSEESQTFYVLDLLCWNSNLCTNYDTECRLFLLKSKVEEVPEILERSTLNPFPFSPLKFFSTEELPTVMTTWSVPFPEEVDGVLFFHKQTFYIYESTNPLCLWIYLSKMLEILAVEVSPELLSKELKTRTSRSRPEKSDNVNMDVAG